MERIPRSEPGENGGKGRARSRSGKQDQALENTERPFLSKKQAFSKSFDSIKEAITFEKQIKGNSRDYKEELISKQNPAREDLSPETEALI